MKKNQRKSTLIWLASRRPTGTGHSAGWHPGDPQEQDIHLAGRKDTLRDRTFSWLESRRPRGTGHSAGRNAGDPEGEDIQLAGMLET